MNLLSATSEPETTQTSETVVRDRRAIVDRRALQGELEAIVAADLADVERRRRVVAVLKDGFAAGVAEVRRRFEAGGPGSLAVRAQCHLVDQLVRVVHDHVIQHLYPLANPTDAERLALVAVGLSSGMATFGVITLVAKGYGLMAWGGILFYIIPLLIVGPWRLWRGDFREPTGADEEPSALEGEHP